MDRYNLNKMIKKMRVRDGYGGPVLRNTRTYGKKTAKDENRIKIMEQFLTLDIGSSKATIDLSQVRKCGLVADKGVFGKKPKIVIYYNDRPDTPEVNFELKTTDEAEETYKVIKRKLDDWATHSNSSKIAKLEKELEIMREQKDAIISEKEVLMDVFGKFKEMMQIMEDETKTSELVETIKSL